MAPSKSLVALALLPAASALGLCNVLIENVNADFMCTKVHGSQGDLDAAGCPVDCIAGTELFTFRLFSTPSTGSQMSCESIAFSSDSAV